MLLGLDPRHRLLALGAGQRLVQPSHSVRDPFGHGLVLGEVTPQRATGQRVAARADQALELHRRDGVAGPEPCGAAGEVRDGRAEPHARGCTGFQVVARHLVGRGMIAIALDHRPQQVGVPVPGGHLVDRHRHRPHPFAG